MYPCAPEFQGQELCNVSLAQTRLLVGANLGWIRPDYGRDATHVFELSKDRPADIRRSPLKPFPRRAQIGGPSTAVLFGSASPRGRHWLKYGAALAGWYQLLFTVAVIGGHLNPGVLEDRLFPGGRARRQGREHNRGGSRVIVQLVTVLPSRSTVTVETHVSGFGVNPDHFRKAVIKHAGSSIQTSLDIHSSDPPRIPASPLSRTLPRQLRCRVRAAEAGLGLHGEDEPEFHSRSTSNAAAKW